ncbi:hypothetical protein ACLKA7_009857 [Drosophila subpalustris]
MLRMGAEDGSATAKEMDEGLSFSSSHAKEIANGFSNVLTSYQQCRVLKMANKLYLMKNYEAHEKFNETLTQKFHSAAENIDFSANTAAANTINGWIESTTNNLIRSIVSPDALNGLTRLVLVNAIHFKGEWSPKFDETETTSEDFFLENGHKSKVSMMHAKKKYYFANLPEMDAKALRLAYKDTDLFMLIVLPNLNEGLKQLEKKLQTASLGNITSRLSLCRVFVKLPKFKVEFEQELTAIFKELGINRLFNGQAELGKMLKSSENLKVSKILHKAFIEVNEEGTEAGAATTMIVALRSTRPEDEPQEFHADHPFYFTIYHANHGCLFVGNLKSPDFSSSTDDKIQVTCNCKKDQCAE